MTDFMGIHRPGPVEEWKGCTMWSNCVVDHEVERPEPPRVIIGTKDIVIVFDGPPGPQTGRFVEVEDAKTRASVGVGEWKPDPRHEGWWLLELRVPETDIR